MGNLIADWRIAELARDGMINPFSPCQVKEIDRRKIVSYGCSSFGYDLRVGNKFKVFTPTHCGVVDPKAFDTRSFVEVESDDYILIPPNSFALGVAVERLKLPRNVTAIILGKSTFARCGICVNCTPAEAGWEGHLTIEISNMTPLPAIIYCGEGIAQCLFFESDNDCSVSYADRNNGKGGKYQAQPAEIVLPKV